MFGLFKKQRPFEPFDIVEPVDVEDNTYYKIGVVKKVIHRWFWTDQVVVEYRSKFLSTLGNYYSIINTTIIYEDPASIRLHEIKNRLIRPLKEGDYFFVSKEVNVFVDNTDDFLTRPVFGYRMLNKRDHIPSDIFEKPQVVFYVSDSLFHSSHQVIVSLNRSISYKWLAVNIDIPRTNRLLIKEFQPKPNAQLPEL